MAIQGPFPAFLSTLEQQAGPTALDSRHELFFQRQGGLGWLQGWLAAGRDVCRLGLSQRQSPTRPLSTSPLALLVATLGGSSGWTTLARALPAIEAAGLSPVILAHPRLPDSLFPPHLSILRPHGAPPLRDGLPRGVSRLAAAQTRHQWWRHAINNAIAPARGVMICHNDFDMMSVAALSLGWPSLCLQHGLPTDEFFPCRATCQVVWGEQAAAAYRAGGLGPSTLVIDALGRGDGQIPPARPPQGLALISQTHAKVFDPALPSHLVAMAHAVGKQAGPAFSVLLHPQESDGTSYAPLPVSRSPHSRLFGPDAVPHVVFGYCSTLLIEAAMAGHWVVGLSLPLAGNGPARSLVTPPLCAESAADVVSVFRRLRKDATVRDAVARDQSAWLAGLFDRSTAQLTDVLRKVTPA